MQYVMRNDASTGSGKKKKKLVKIKVRGQKNNYNNNTKNNTLVKKIYLPKDKPGWTNW